MHIAADRDFVERRAGYRIRTREISRVSSYNDYEKTIRITSTLAERLYQAGISDPETIRDYFMRE